ncbi:keratin, type II cytoskeletal 1-like isoform X2 [Drosophila guanche]|uniref:keratin, type II cytoskeletal 1-like isoform X2 n=1 Tax=Drosophila guanche TaxID=7266 RepID=UPI001470A011|nr:keratin, type II cytoskeletal 1-like isoform X2 [Drosophila guanche]
MRAHHLNLLVLSVGMVLLLAVAQSQLQETPAEADVKQLTLADVNQGAEQQEMPAVRLARQFGGGYGGRGFGGGGRRRFGGGGFGGGGYGRRRGFGGGFYPPPPFFGGPFFG